MTDNEKMTIVLGHIVTMTDSRCLETIQNTAFNHKRDVNQKQANVETASWEIGDDVQLLPEHQGRKPYGATGTIKKINKVRMRVAFPSGTWNVPKIMLMKAN